MYCVQVVEATLSQEVYAHEEDFFFRTVHLGTECWSFVALNRMAAAQQLAEEGQWHVAAARIIQVAQPAPYGLSSLCYLLGDCPGHGSRSYSCGNGLQARSLS